MKFFYILIAIMILLVMITIHEFGHYIAGKILKFKIDEFSIGFGPKLFQKRLKNGELFSIRWLPLGGYCAFAGESDEEKILAPEKMKQDVFGEHENAENDDMGAENDKSKTALVEKSEQGDIAESAEKGETEQNSTAPESEKGENGNTELKMFNEQPPWKRIIVLIAGGTFNILSAVIFSFIFIIGAGAGTATINKVYNSVESGQVCTLEAGDEFVSIDGTKIDFYHTIADALADKKEGDMISVVVKRDGKEISIVTPIRKYDPEDENVTEIPVGMGVSMAYSRATVGDAFKYCVPYTAKLSWLILGTFGDMIVGKVPLNQLSGTVGTINQMADLGMQDWAYFLVLLPLIAANLGIFNLFPIPALDGAKVVFTVIEWIRGKPINQKVESTIHLVGLIVIFAFVIILDAYNLIFSKLF